MAYDDEKKKINDYYTQLKEENYKTLLDSQIQLENARQRASKQMGVGLAAGGMDTSGYASQAQNNLESQYLTGLQQNQNKFNEQNNYIKTSEQTALTDLAIKEQDKADEEAQFTVAKIKDIIDSGTFNTVDELLNALSDFGHYDGTQWVPDVNISETDAAYINGLIRNAQRDIYAASQEADENGETVGDSNYIAAEKAKYEAMGNGGSDFASLSNIATEAKGYTLGNDCANELNFLLSMPTKYPNFKFNNGDVVRLQHHGNGSKNGAFLIYFDGKWYKSDKAHWNKAANRCFIEDGEIDNGWDEWEIRGTFSYL